MNAFFFTRRKTLLKFIYFLPILKKEPKQSEDQYAYDNTEELITVTYRIFSKNVIY